MLNRLGYNKARVTQDNRLYEFWPQLMGHYLTGYNSTGFIAQTRKNIIKVGKPTEAMSTWTLNV